MINFKDLIKEAQSSTVVLAFARMNPVTVGHGLVVEKVLSEAKKHSAPHFIYLSATQDKKKNPLNVKQKVYWARKSFPGANFVGATDKVRTFIEAVKEMDGSYKNLILIAGSDRVPEYQTLLNKYNGRDFQFESITVVSAGERDPDADGATGMSATKMRAAATANDFASFRKGTSPKLSDSDTRKLMQDVRNGLGIKNVLENAFQVSRERNAFYLGQTHKIGEVVTDGTNLFEILDRGSNYIVVVNESGEISKKFINGVKIAEDLNMPYASPESMHSGFQFKGYKPSKEFLENHQIVSAFEDTVSRYESGQITDAIAILRAMKNVDEMIAHIQLIVDQGEHSGDHEAVNAKVMEHVAKARESLSAIGEFEHHQQYLQAMLDLVQYTEAEQPDQVAEQMETPIVKSSDKLKVARIIADTFGVDSSGSNAEVMVNAALRQMKKKPVRPEMAEVINNMLSLATEVGIKFDKNLAPKGISEDQLDEISDETAKSYAKKAMQDTMSGKKDRNAGMKKAYSRIAGTFKPLIKEKTEDLDATTNKVEKETLGYDQFNRQLKKHVELRHGETPMHPEAHKPGHTLDSNDLLRKLKTRKIRGDD